MLCPRCHRTYPSEEKHCGYDGAELTDARRVDIIAARQTRHLGAVIGGRYSIRGFIGQGGTARVYLVEDLQSGEPAALKLLEPPWSQDRVARERFAREAEAARAVEHPNVVQIHHVGVRSNGTPYLVMEYLHGESLASLLARESRLGVDIALPVFASVAEALVAAHAGGVLHRDLKPDNIFLVGEPGEPYGVKVVDFGLAKLRDATITAAGTAIGTAAFMSPEQCVADEADARSDVYGLGMTMFQVLTGSLPFEADAPEDFLAHNLITEPAAPSSLVPELGPDLDAVVRKCLRKDPSRRYSTMAELAGELDALLQERHPSAAAAEQVAGDDHYTPKTPFSVLVAKALRKRLAALASDVARPQ
jgi:serine/threonine-protein kinase